MALPSLRLRWLLGSLGLGLLLVLVATGAYHPRQWVGPAEPTQVGGEVAASGHVAVSGQADALGQPGVAVGQPGVSGQASTSGPIQAAEHAQASGQPAPAGSAPPTEVATPRQPHLAVPVLMYHVIAAGPNSLFVPPAEFEGHLDYLAQAGYQTISLQQLADHFERGTALPERPVVLTFDDGYASVYDAALPLLQRYQMTGTFFIITDLVGQTGYVTWEQLQEMAAAGMEIGSHTVSHPDLTMVSGQGLTWQLAESRRLLEERLAVPVRFFAYPAGRYDDESVAAMREHYLGAVTTVGGMATPCQDRLLWRRVRVNDGLGPDQLGRLLRYWTEESQAQPCARPAWAE